MTAYTAMGLVSTGFPIPDTLFTYGLHSTIDVVADLGKAVTLDTTATNTMKLAGTSDPIHGILVLAEDRAALGKVGTVARQFKEKLPTVAGSALAVGMSVTGNSAAPGNVLPMAGGAHDGTLVIEVDPAGLWVAVESW